MRPALRATLIGVADALRDADEPWWIITGAAVALHGGTDGVADVRGADEAADVDVLTGADDARRLLGAAAAAGTASGRYRSAVFGRIDALPLPVEVMAGFELFADGAWRPIRFATRAWVAVDGAMLPVPDRAELAALLAAIGRPKDRARIAMLAS